MLWLCPQAQATPYATSLTNDAGTISFRLNESADNVKIISAGGATTNDLGALPAGLHTTNLAISGTFQVVVFKVSPLGFVTPIAPNRAAVLQISTDTNLVRFNNPRGVMVNTDPASPYFGRVYISNTSTGLAPNSTRTLGDGIYMLNADLTDAVGQGDTALTGGLDFSASPNSSPYRVAIGQDNNLYITDFSDTNGSVYVTDPNVGAGTGLNVLGGPVGGPFPVSADRIHGSIAAAWVEGSLGAGNLTAYVLDEDYQMDPATTTASQRHSLWRHDIGGALPGPFVAPTQIALHPNSFIRTVGNQTLDLTRGTNGYFYVSNYRSSGNELGVWVLDAAGMLLWNSLVQTRTLPGMATAPDLLRATGGLDVSRAGDYMAIINIESNGITILPLLGGLPDITNRLQFQGFPTSTGQGRDVAFDRAGNLYAVATNSGLLRVFSPGGTTTTTTGSDGTFDIILPPNVSVVASDPIANEEGPGTATFTLTRTGDTTEALVVNYTLTGSAVNGTDYQTNILSATIPGGSATGDIVITPVDDALAEATETVVITLVGAASYNIKAPITDTAYIVDNERPVLTISAVDTNSYERLALDTVSFTVTRLGDTNVDIFGVGLVTSGTASENVDYTPPPLSVGMPPGTLSFTVVITNIDDLEYEGDETIILSLAEGDEYFIGTPGSATARIQDNECPPAAVLFSDNLDSDTSANWIVRFGANNGVFDAITNWAFDYSALGLGPSPNSDGISTRGLRVSVNKDTTASSAGINLYPAGQQFSGDYALRFDLYMSVGNSNTTEHALAGINHSGMLTNRIRQSSGVTNATTTDAAGSDGIWVNIEPANSNLRDYAAYSSTNPAAVPYMITNRPAFTLASLIPSPPYISAGAIGNRSNSFTKTWADVELRQVGDVVRLSVNKNPVLEFTNTYGFTNGNIMIGHNDQFDSVGSPLNFAIFDNVRVVDLGLRITSIQLVGGNVEIDFTSPLAGQAGDFMLQSATDLSLGDWSNVGATITATASGFHAVASQAPGNRFYRIRR